MPKCGFSLKPLFFAYKNRIYDSLLIPENTVKRKSVLWCMLRSDTSKVLWTPLKDYSFSTYAKYSEKLIFLTPSYCAYQGVRNVSFSENFAHVLNEWSLMMIMNCFVVWLTDERRLALFPARTTARDPRHHESPTRREQDLNLLRARNHAVLNEVVQ